MAKARKSDATDSTTSKKPVRKLKKAAAPGSTQAEPLIDTQLAAQNAARMLAARAKLGAAARVGSSSASPKESSTFKQMKENLNRPPAHLATSALGTALGPQKSGLPAYGQAQVVRDQTVGVGRFNVPRRTAGG